MNLFEKLGLDADIVMAVNDLGFTAPTPIQEKAIPQILSGNADLVALAQTGTGKTAAFGLPITQLVDFSQKRVQALIIAPTRELCLQISNDLKNYTKYKDNANIATVYGGASIDTQIRELQRGAQIIAATPGRMVDIIDRGKVNLSEVNIVVLDEADEMLNMGFKEDLDRILRETPDEKNTWLFSATMPEEVRRIAKNYMEKPVEISTGKQNQSADNIEHIYYHVSPREKYSALKRIADSFPDIFGIIFCRTRAETQEIADKLIGDGYNADALHGDLSQYQRDQVMKKFRNRQLRMLVATDVAARGIDVDNITHVINYNLPEDVDNYTHRSGRTARAGKSGISIALVGSRELDKIHSIERKIKKQFTAGKIPTGTEVCERILVNFAQQIKQMDDTSEKFDHYLKTAVELFADISKEELVRKLVLDKFNTTFEYYQKNQDISTLKGVKSRKELSAGGGNMDKPFTRYFINLGRQDDLSVGDLINLVCTTLDCSKQQLGRIDLKNTFSFFELDNTYNDLITSAFKKKQFRGRNVRIEASEGSFPDRQSSHGSRSAKPYSGEGKSSSGGSRPRTAKKKSDSFGEKMRSRRSQEFRF